MDSNQFGSAGPIIDWIVIGIIYLKREEVDVILVMDVHTQSLTNRAKSKV